MIEELKIYQKLQDMLHYAEDCCLNQFPKHQRYVLAARIRDNIDLLLELCITANKRYYKKTTMQDMDIQPEMLRARVRLAYQLRILPDRKYENWSQMLDEIGRMIGGWIRSLNAPKQQ